MKKIVLIPLDERPCNYHFPQDLFQDTDYTVVVPDVSIMGNKKTPGDTSKIWDFLETEAKDAFGVVLAIDTLIYGGIVPSRLHSNSVEQLLELLKRLEHLKETNPNLQVYAYNLIMRNPTYSSNDEEPDYYEDCGREIHLRGVYEHKQSLGILSLDEQKEYQKIIEVLDEEAWVDYTSRRVKNSEVNKRVIEYVHEGFVDFLIIPQDDASPYGLTAIDQKIIRNHIKNQEVMSKVYMYPGADEVANTLLARMMNFEQGIQPTVYLKYASEGSKMLIPSYEDRPLHETVKYQVSAAGGYVIASDIDADLIVIINAPPSHMLNSSQAHLKGIEYDAFRNIVECVSYAEYMINQGKKVVIADVAYGNGSDLELIQLLVEKNLLFKLAGYAGWNTSSNTLGTCIPQGMVYHVYGQTQAHLNFLSLRYTEDAGYCSTVRQQACAMVLPQLGLNYFKADGQRGVVSLEVKKLLEEFLETHIKDAQYGIEILDCYMPWSRMFEVGLRTRIVKK